MGLIHSSLSVCFYEKTKRVYICTVFRVSYDLKFTTQKLYSHKTKQKYKTFQSCITSRESATISIQGKCRVSTIVKTKPNLTQSIIKK